MSADDPAPVLPSAASALLLGASGMGFPLTQLVIRRSGRRGALVTAGVMAGLLARAVYLLGTGTAGRLETGPARLLAAEAVTAAVATGASLFLLRDPTAAPARQEGWHVPAGELVRRASIGTLFGIHTMRLRIYLAPGSGTRPRRTDPAA